MQITLDIPDNLPLAIVQQYINELELKLKQLQNLEDFKIDEQACLNALANYNSGDKTNIAQIGDIDDYINNLKHEIS
jgi:hypothetical protein